MSRFRIALALVVIAACMVPLLGAANHTDVTDPRDARGAYDVRRVTTWGAMRAGFKVSMWRRWTVRGIRDKSYLLVYLDTFGGERPDYYALVASNGHRLKGAVYRDTRRGDHRKFGIRSWHPDGRSAALRIPLGRLRIGEGRLLYRWNVKTLNIGDVCRRVCFDEAPDGAVVTEPLPGLVPTPTVTTSTTPTPTPTPSP